MKIEQLAMKSRGRDPEVTHDDSLLQLKCLSILISPAVFPQQFGKAAESKNKPKQRDTQSGGKFQF